MSVYEPALVGIVDAMQLEPSLATDGMRDHAISQAHKLAWMTVVIATQAKDPQLLQSQEFQQYAGFIYDRLSRLAMGTFDKLMRENAERVLVSVKSEVAECMSAVSRAKTLLGSGAPYAMNPIYEVVEAQFPASPMLVRGVNDLRERLNKAYGPLMRKAVSAVRSG